MNYKPKSNNVLYLPSLLGGLTSPPSHSMAEIGCGCFSCYSCYAIGLVIAQGLPSHSIGHVARRKRGLKLQRVHLACWQSSSPNGIGFIALPALSLKITHGSWLERLMPFGKHLASSLASSDLLTQHRSVFILGIVCHCPVHKGHPKPDEVSLLHYCLKHQAEPAASIAKELLVQPCHLLLCVHPDC